MAGLVSVVSIQVVVVDLDLTADGPTTPADATDPEYEGLHDGDELLGDAENVSAGDNDLDAELGGSGDGDAPAGSAPSAYDTGEIPADDVESQQAGFGDSERVEDSELIREYTLRLRNETDE